MIEIGHLIPMSIWRVFKQVKYFEKHGNIIDQFLNINYPNKLILPLLQNNSFYSAMTK